MTGIIILMYGFFAVNFFITFFIKSSKHICKYIRILSLAGIYIVYILSISSYIQYGEIAKANITEADNNSLTYSFLTSDNTYITNTVDPEKINFKGDVGDFVLVRYLSAEPHNNKINTYDTIFNAEFALISLTEFVIFMLWGILPVNIAFNKKNHSNKKILLRCIGCIVSIALLVCLAVNIAVNAENTYFTGDVNTTVATVVKTDITGTEYKFTGKNNLKNIGKALGVYGFELPVGSSVSVEYDTNNKSRIKNKILASRPSTVAAWCLCPFIAFGFGIILSYIINVKNLKYKILTSNIFKENPEENVPQRNMFVIAFKVLAIAVFAEAIIQIRNNFSVGIMMLFMSVFCILFAITFDKRTKK